MRKRIAWLVTTASAVIGAPALAAPLPAAFTASPLVATPLPEPRLGLLILAGLAFAFWRGRD